MAMKLQVLIVLNLICEDRQGHLIRHPVGLFREFYQPLVSLNGALFALDVLFQSSPMNEFIVC